MAALLLGADVACYRCGLLAHDGVAVAVSHIGGLSALVVPHVVADGHEHLVISEGAVFAIRLLVAIPAPQHQNRSLHAYVGLKRIWVHVNRAQDLRVSQNPLAHIAQAGVA